MNAVKIVSSQADENTVLVTWSDGVQVYYSAADLSKDPVVVELLPSTISTKEYMRRVVVSRTSAQVTLQGCAYSA